MVQASSHKYWNDAFYSRSMNLSSWIPQVLIHLRCAHKALKLIGTDRAVYSADTPTSIQWWTCAGTRMATGCWLPLVITCWRCLTSATWSLSCRLSRDTRKRPHVRKWQDWHRLWPFCSSSFLPPPLPPHFFVHAPMLGVWQITLYCSFALCR